MMTPNTSFISSSSCKFPNFRASSTWPIHSSSVIGSFGHCDPFSRINFIFGQRGWYLRRGKRIEGFVNSKPYPTVDFDGALMLALRSRLWFIKMRFFFSAASNVSLKQNSGFIGQGLSELIICLMISDMVVLAGHTFVINLVLRIGYFWMVPTCALVCHTFVFNLVLRIECGGPMLSRGREGHCNSY